MWITCHDRGINSFVTHWACGSLRVQGPSPPSSPRTTVRLLQSQRLSVPPDSRRMGRNVALGAICPCPPPLPADTHAYLAACSGLTVGWGSAKGKPGGRASSFQPVEGRGQQPTQTAAGDPRPAPMESPCPVLRDRKPQQRSLRSSGAPHAKRQ